jgi:hypothetical protein
MLKNVVACVLCCCARAEGLGESQFRRGDIHCGTLYIYVLYARNSQVSANLNLKQ